MPAKKAKRRGRPPRMADGKRWNLYLPQATVDRARQIGGGNVSLGVQRAVEAAELSPDTDRASAGAE